MFALSIEVRIFYSTDDKCIWGDEGVYRCIVIAIVCNYTLPPIAEICIYVFKSISVRLLVDNNSFYVS